MPVSVTWSEITGIGVEDRQVVVRLVDGRRLIDHAVAVPDLDLFVDTVSAAVHAD